MASLYLGTGQLEQELVRTLPPAGCLWVCVKGVSGAVLLDLGSGQQWRAVAAQLHCGLHSKVQKQCK